MNNSISGMMARLERTPEENARLFSIYQQEIERLQGEKERPRNGGGLHTQPDTVPEQSQTAEPEQSRPKLTNRSTNADRLQTADDRAMQKLPKKIKTTDNLPFVQMPHCITISDMTDAEYRLYGLLLKYHTMRRGINVSVSQMARELGKTRRSIKSVLSLLEARGYIKRDFIQGKNTKISLFYNKCSEENFTPTGEENFTPTGEENFTPTGEENFTHNNNEYNKNEKINISQEQMQDAHTHEREREKKTSFEVLIDFSPSGFTIGDFNSLDQAALKIDYTMSIDEMVKFLCAMHNGYTITKDGTRKTVKNWDRLLRTWKDNQSEDAKEIAHQERARLANCEPVKSAEYSFNGEKRYCTISALKSVTTNLEKAFFEKFPNASGTAFCYVVNELKAKKIPAELFISALPQMPDRTKDFDDPNCFFKERSKFYYLSKVRVW